MNAIDLPLLKRRVFTVREADLRHDADALDTFVCAQPGATPFHRPQWLQAVERGTGQRARVLIAERGKAVVAVLPLTEVRSALFGGALVSTGFGVDGGILGESAAIEPLAGAAWHLARRLGIRSVELRGGPAPLGWSVDDTTYFGFARDLAPDAERELLAIPRKQRAEVRKSIAGDLTVEVGHDLATHYRVYAESVRNLGTPVFPPRLFHEVAAAIDSDVTTVRWRGAPVASVLSLYHNGTVYPYWGGGSRMARQLRANDRMYFALMRHAYDRGCTRFDFGRSKAGTGAAAFKRNWGFEGRPLSYARRSDGPARTINPLSPKYRAQVALWKHLPLLLANAVGPWISRGFG